MNIRVLHEFKLVSYMNCLTWIFVSYMNLNPLLLSI